MRILEIFSYADTGAFCVQGNAMTEKCIAGEDKRRVSARYLQGRSRAIRPTPRDYCADEGVKCGGVFDCLPIVWTFRRCPTIKIDLALKNGNS